MIDHHRIRATKRLPLIDDSRHEHVTAVGEAKRQLNGWHFTTTNGETQMFLDDVWDVEIEYIGRSAVVISWSHTGCTAQVVRRGGGFVLEWSDGVVNEWSEEYEDEATAVLRLACLIRCVTTDPPGFFAHGRDRFAEEAEAFLTDEVS